MRLNATKIRDVALLKKLRDRGNAEVVRIRIKNRLLITKEIYIMVTEVNAIYLFLTRDSGLFQRQTY